MASSELPTRYAQWAERLRSLGLQGIIAALLEGGAPLAPLAGQLLYIAQPTLGLFVSRRAIGDLAEWLDQPDSLAQFRQALEDNTADHGDADPASAESNDGANGAANASAAGVDQISD